MLLIALLLWSNMHLDYGSVLAISWYVVRLVGECLWAVEKERVKGAYCCHLGKEPEEGTSELMKIPCYELNTMRQYDLAERALAWKPGFYFSVTDLLSVLGRVTSPLCLCFPITCLVYLDSMILKQGLPHPMCMYSYPAQWGTDLDWHY